MKAYFISGLGADKRAFQKITLPEPFETIHLEWITPLPKEPLAQYARRFSEQIDSSEDFILTGLSFGGLVATEISKIIRPHKLILISSAATRRELPLLYRLAGNIYIDRLYPYKKMVKPNRLFNWAFGPLDNESQELVNRIVTDTDPAFTKWAVGEIVRWKNKEIPANLLQIHGSKDKIFWPSASKASILMSGGGHLCVYSHGQVITSLIVNNCTN
jgi:pimeloyl-ACP methyl ester carboxylesterase